MHRAAFLPSLSRRQQDGLALALITLVALLFRTWRLDAVPPGLFGDEAVNGLDALDVLAGRPQVFFPANYGREGLHMLVLAPFIRWLGAGALALRLPSALAGILTCLATYWLGRELLARTRYQGSWVPLLAALFVSTSYWHVHFSRFGIRGVFTPLMTALALAAFWRGANQVAGWAQKHDSRLAGWGWFMVAGLAMGLGVHFYTASRLVPLFLGGFLLLQGAFVWWQEAGRRASQPGSHPALLRRALRQLMLLYAVAAVAFAPLGLYFLRTPGSLTQRADAVSLFNPSVSGGNPWGRMVQAATANLAQFFLPGAGDQATFYNLPGRAVLDPVTAVLAALGVVICLRAAWRGSSAHLFLLLWFPAMLLPTFLAVDRFPTLPRALGVLPGLYFFPAMGLAGAAGWLGRRELQGKEGQSGPRSWLAAALVVAVISWHGSLTWRDYFQRWATSAETFEAFEGDMVAAATWLAAHPDQEVFLSSDIYRHPSLVFLHEQVPLTEFMQYQDPRVHFFDGRFSLPLAPAGQGATYLFTDNAGPGPWLTRVPGWAGFQAGNAWSAPSQGLQIEQLPAVTPWTTAALNNFEAAGVSFGTGIRLVGYRLLRQQEAGGLALLWQVAGPQPGRPHGLQVQAGLQEPVMENQSTQSSSELGYRATEWVEGGRILSWSELALPDQIPDGTQLVLRLVDRQNGVPLAAPNADGDGWVHLPVSAPD